VHRGEVVRTPASYSGDPVSILSPQTCYPEINIASYIPLGLNLKNRPLPIFAASIRIRNSEKSPHSMLGNTVIGRVILISRVAQEQY
jgi:hypothetical protein